MTISATANYGYHFTNWNDGNTETPRVVKVTSDKTYTAYFEKNTYYVTKKCNTNEGCINGPSSGEYLDNITLIAKPNYGYHFVQWSDGNSNNTLQFILTQDTSCTAEFSQTITGQCGDNLYWSYQNNTLTISGFGEMYNERPWGLFANDIQNVVLPDGITHIGDDAFSNCVELSEIIIPYTVTSIGDYAFAGCSKLVRVNCYATKPPIAETTSFENYNVYLNVPCDNLQDYQLDIIFGSFKNIQCVGTESYNVPTVTTNAITQITQTTAVAGGNVKAHGGVCVTERGVVYSTSPTPTTTDNKIICGIGTGAFTCKLTNLQVGTTYYVRAYAVNNIGTAYGEELSFSTFEIPKFSVSENKQITFSKGNLQYTRSTKTWSFAENQWDYIGIDNVTGGSVSYDDYGAIEKEGNALADKIDLFGWSASNKKNFGVSISLNSSFYSGSFVDWGANKIGVDTPNTWRTLTYNEWEYLLDTRTNASSLRGVAQINGVNGLILLPDNWVCPSGVNFKSGFSEKSFNANYYADYQTFTTDQWSKLETAGAVFLPAAGNRAGSDVYSVQVWGNYWSATKNDSSKPINLEFLPQMKLLRENDCFGGNSVRLVKDL